MSESKAEYSKSTIYISLDNKFLSEKFSNQLKFLATSLQNRDFIE